MTESVESVVKPVVVLQADTIKKKTVSEPRSSTMLKYSFVLETSSTLLTLHLFDIYT